MHPEVIRDKPGKCPKCGMDLIPLMIESAAGLGPRQLVISEDAAKLMEIQTSVVERKFVTAEIRMVGKVDYDETRVKNITAWVAGRIDRLFVDFTGITVNKGDHMVELYSPELISAQAELLLYSTKLLAREKLRLLGLTAEQIEQIEKTGKPVDHLTIRAPIGGVVIHKNATEGMYVDTGTPIYRVADLSPLVIPVSAALVTGRKLDRAVVYVKKPDTEKPTYEGREIVLGPRAGDYYIVKSGLAEGEIVVTNGNFKIDSAMQIQAKPSMMSPEGEKAPAGHHGHSH